MSDELDRRDSRLGQALTEALSLEDSDAFAARVLSAAETNGLIQRPIEWWDVLVAWSRPGLAAAALFTAIAFGVTRNRADDSVARQVGDLTETNEVEVLAEATPPELEEFLAIAVRRSGR